MAVDPVIVDTEVMEVTQVVVGGVAFLTACDVVDVTVVLEGAEVVDPVFAAVRTAKILP